MNRRRLILIIVGFIFSYQYISAQTDFHIEFNQNITFRHGQIYGIGLGHSFKNVRLSTGLNYADLGIFKGSQLADVSTTGNGVGIKVSAITFINELERKGAYIGIRADAQFLNNKRSSPCWPPCHPTIIKSNHYVIVGQLGYSLDLSDNNFIQFHISSGASLGENDHSKHKFLLVTGIQFSTYL